MLESIEKGEVSGEEIAWLHSSISQVEDLLKEGWSQEIELVLNAGTAISACQEENQVLTLLARYLLELLDARTCNIWYWEQQQNSLKPWGFDLPDQTYGGEDLPNRLQLNLYPFWQQALSSVRPLRVSSANNRLRESEKERMQALDIEDLVLAPFSLPGRVLGLIEVGGSAPGVRFSDSTLSFAQILSNQSAFSLERIWLTKDVSQRSAELEAVHKASLSLTASLDLQEVLDTILENTLELLSDAQDAHIFLYEEEKLIFGAALWSGGRKGMAWANPRSGGLTYSVAKGGEVINVADMRDHPLYKDAPLSWTGSIVGLPLKIGPRVVGVMTVADAKTNAFNERKLHILRLLADQAAIAIENARLHNMVTRQARTDTLTGLPNRRAFNERLAEEVRRANRYQQSLSLLMVDLTTFKRVNDTYGHPVGDLVLKQISTCLRRSMRGSDFLARYGGDEFTVVLPGSDRQAAELIACRLIENVRSYQLDIPGTDGESISLEIGIASYPVQAETMENLLKIADDDLYLAKESGNSCQE